MTLPNLLIVGAMKSGTTTLHNQLAAHPEVFMSEKKEPHFFSFEGREQKIRQPSRKRRNTVTTLAEYEALFANAGKARVIGESSTTYLHTEQAPECIKRHVPRAKLVAILREPVERAWSHFQHAMRAGREPNVVVSSNPEKAYKGLAEGFEEALIQEEERLAEGWGDPYGYKLKGFYAQQLKRYYKLFSREQIFVCLFDDLKADPAALYHQLVDFLGVDPSFQPDFSQRYNVGAEAEEVYPYEPGLGERLTRLLSGKGWSVPPVDPSQQKLPIPEGPREQLRALYRPEIEELEELIGRDLSAWKK